MIMMINTDNLKGKIVELYLREWIEDLLIGYVLEYDENGILFYNIDFRGIGTGWVYLSIEKISFININSPYLGKIVDLFFVKNQQITQCDINSAFELKEEFINWICKHDKWIRIADQREELVGKICEIGDGQIVMKKYDWTTRNSNGYSVLLLEYVDFLCEYKLI